jgi:nitrous oxidase accessory protein NosD
MVIKANRFEGNNTENFEVNNCSRVCNVAGLKTVSMQRLDVFANTFLNNRTLGYWCDLSCTDTEIYLNTATGNYGGGLYYETGGRGDIHHNKVEGTTGVSNEVTAGIMVSGSEDVRITNNRLIGNVRQIGMYEDDRPPDPYGQERGLTWNTVRAVVNDNVFTPNGTTVRLLQSKGTAANLSPGMFAQALRNNVEDPTNQRFSWATAPGFGREYVGLCAFETVSRLDFGTVCTP